MRPPEQLQKDSNNQHQPKKQSDKNLFKSDVWNESHEFKSNPQRPFYFSNRYTFATALIMSLLICGICLAVVVTLWLTSGSTETYSSAGIALLLMSSSTIISSTSTTLIIAKIITSTATVATRTITYSQNFTFELTATAQCTAWTSFVTQLIVQPYILLTMSGTFNPIGVSVTNTTVIANIALALRTSTRYGPVTSNSLSWAVGLCGPSYELSASGTTCMCTSPGYAIRPCLTNQNYGGINTTTCSGPTQTMTVIFQY
ncbi:unnamed protein product [Rotaria magnacalcarata]|uniref:Uncharacterized protein n=1 Tax=Rotaria magnacalcarata TaxID=392030 RepID=A0A820AAQ8_9BILA|nr:unnamed protein product [Rotaria magnacalcarata]CAF4182671.1 unnamed protein product [Rotaria magnacalcarata]